MDIAVFQFIGGTVNNAIDSFLLPAAGRLMLAIDPLVISGVVIYIVLIGISIVMGTDKQPVGRLVISALKIVFVAAIALNVDNYGRYVVDAFTGLEAGLSSALNGTENAGSIYVVLDDVMGKGVAVATKAFTQASEAGMFSPGAVIMWGLCGTVVAFATVIVAVLGGAAILVAKFLLAVLFAVGPLFVLLLMFPATSRYFDSWFSQIFNHTLVVVIVGVVMAFAMTAFGAFMDAADVSGSGEVSPVAVMVEVAALCAVLSFVIYQAGNLAAGLAGGLSTAAFTAGAMAGSWRTPHNALNPVSTRRDSQSGMQSSARRLDHIVAGNTIANPAYTKQLFKQIGRNYSMSSPGGKVKNETTK